MTKALRESKLGMTFIRKARRRGSGRCIVRVYQAAGQNIQLNWTLTIWMIFGPKTRPNPT